MVNNRKRFRKFIYKILKKMHDLERPKKIEYFQKKTLNNEAYILIALNNIKILLEDYFIYVQDQNINNIYDEFKKQYEILINHVESCYNEKKKLEKGILSKLLTKFTRLFNEMDSKKIFFKINS